MSEQEEALKALTIPVRLGWNQDIGERSYQEDEVVCVPDLNALIPDSVTCDKSIRRAFCAVYDGHGGHRCSLYLREHLHRNLAEHPLIGSQPDEALAQVWNKIEESFLLEQTRLWEERKVKRGGGSAFPRDGSTAVVCLLIGNRVYVANCGDSHAVLYRKSPSSADELWQVLTVAHDTANPSEKLRVLSSNAELRDQFRREYFEFPYCCTSREVITSKPRLYPGGLLVTRAFGDFHAKLPLVGGREGTVICTPAVNQIELDDTVFCLCLGSDGVFDPLAPETIYSLLHKSTSNLEVNSASEATPKSTEDPQGWLNKVCSDIVQTAVTSNFWTRLNADADNASLALIFCLPHGILGADW